MGRTEQEPRQPKRLPSPFVGGHDLLKGEKWFSCLVNMVCYRVTGGGKWNEP